MFWKGGDGFSGKKFWPSFLFSCQGKATCKDLEIAYCILQVLWHGLVRCGHYLLLTWRWARHYLSLQSLKGAKMLGTEKETIQVVCSKAQRREWLLAIKVSNFEINRGAELPSWIAQRRVLYTRWSPPLPVICVHLCPMKRPKYSKSTSVAVFPPHSRTGRASPESRYISETNPNSKKGGRA